MLVAVKRTGELGGSLVSADSATSFLLLELLVYRVSNVSDDAVQVLMSRRTESLPFCAFLVRAIGHCACLASAFLTTESVEPVSERIFDARVLRIRSKITSTAHRCRTVNDGTPKSATLR